MAIGSKMKYLLSEVVLVPRRARRADEKRVACATASCVGRSRCESGRRGLPILGLDPGCKAESKKPIEIGYTAIAKMAYEILVWVLILLRMILDHPAAL